jgi:hypothetical protein
LRGFEANRDNASLYRHIGILAIYDHAYFNLDEGLCTRIWRHDESYAQVEGYMVQQKFPLHDNLRTVNTNDADAYDKMIERNAADLEQIPDEWLNGQEG